MDWEAIGSIGEIVGALAVLGSLYYLASQIKRQNKESRRANNEAGVRHVTETWGVVSNDANLADIVLRGSNGELSEPEQVFRYYCHLGRFYRGLENIYIAYCDGDFDARLWEGILNACKDVHATPGAQTYWKNRPHHYSAEFREFMNTLDFSTDTGSLITSTYTTT